MDSILNEYEALNMKKILFSTLILVPLLGWGSELQFGVDTAVYPYEGV